MRVGITEITKRVATATKQTLADVEKTLNSTLEQIVIALKKEDEFVLKGFGSLKLANQKARTGRNPATGKAMDIPAKKAVRFHASSTLKEAVNTKKKK